MLRAELSFPRRLRLRGVGANVHDLITALRDISPQGIGEPGPFLEPTLPSTEAGDLLIEKLAYLISDLVTIFLAFQ